jgi:hypothetical protein
MKSKPKQIHTLNAGIFPFKIMLSAGFTYDEIMKELKRQKCDQWLAGLKEEKAMIDSASNFAIKRVVSNKKHGDQTLFYIIFIKPFDFSDWAMCTLAHEVLHICQFMLPLMLDRDREYECEAYLHTHIMEQVLHKLRGK